MPAHVPQYKDLEQDWYTLCQNCTDCWTSSDLQLAAELGKTLLERNKELETALKQHQNVIEEQTQEIEYLTKQTAALREVNDSRLRIYEQLEVSIQELEHTNQKLSVDNISDKKLIKTLTSQIESLELRCEDLQKSVDEMAVAQESARRRQRRSICTPDTPVPATTPALPLPAVPAPAPADDEELLQLLQQVQELRSQRARDQRRVADLEDQMTQLIQENACLEERVAVLHQKEEEMQSLQEELSTLEEIRQGHLCRRCLRGQDAGTLTADEDDDDISVIDSLVDESQRKSVLMQLQESLGDSCHGDNPYRDLVEKYEALLKVQRHPGVIRPPQTVSSNNCLSLQEELQLSGDFFQKEEIDSEGETRELPKKDPVKITPNGKAFSATPTDFSEAETSSSGFSDETSNKGTQTDAHFPPGSFLCTISDGDDCRFSIYDDASPVESRFRKTPEYRQLFREIFAVLKRAAEAKDEGEKLPLLDDFTPVAEEAPKVPPVTPAKEDFPSRIPDPEEEMSQFTEDQSDIVSLDPPESVSSSFAAGSDLPCGSTPKVNRNDAPLPCDESAIIQSPEQGPSSSTEERKKPTRDYMECLSSGVGPKKKSSKKKSVITVESAQVLGITAKIVHSSKVTRRKKEVRMNESVNKTADRVTWCVSDNDVVNRVNSEKSETQRHSSAWDSHFTKAATQVATLKLLDKSYAEVLRQSGRKKSHSRGHNSHRN
ncbi:cerebellar degeneration-related protein 2-like isoform X2 [Macrosteles quadrilineatus]|uniref:cerebellar degeneration-related protein 2-like isoform X2 n=1 Tax=Macrosteles quadrilineatus TaxID=74068 RepID=UPI0023E13DCD|nr:cerebellar degeneration-related protein 2-like isoform X2 [Macrosteles quadrilineatus]